MVGLLAFGGIFAMGCSSSSSSTTPVTPDPTSDAGAAGDSSTPTALPAGDLGKSCSGGCAGSGICTVSDPTCSTGHCLFDVRDGSGQAYCTADCTSAACPSGFRCEDVPFKLLRACVRDSTPVGPTAPRVKGTVSVAGTLGAHGKPATAYSSEATLDATPVATFAALKCNDVLVQPAGGGAKAATITINLCKASDPSYVKAYVSFKLPLQDGTTASPPVFTRVGDVNTSSLKSYGDFRLAQTEPGMTLKVEKAAVQGTTSPFKVEHLTLHLSGDVAASTGFGDSCGAGAASPGCGEGGTSVTVTADLELTNVTPQ